MKKTKSQYKNLAAPDLRGGTFASRTEAPLIGAGSEAYLENFGEAARKSEAAASAMKHYPGLEHIYGRYMWGLRKTSMGGRALAHSSWTGTNSMEHGFYFLKLVFEVFGIRDHAGILDEPEAKGGSSFSIGPQFFNAAIEDGRTGRNVKERVVCESFPIANDLIREICGKLHALFGGDPDSSKRRLIDSSIASYCQQTWAFDRKGWNRLLEAVMASARSSQRH